MLRVSHRRRRLEARPCVLVDQDGSLLPDRRGYGVYSDDWHFDR
jgi:hypothetical protein